MKTHLPRGRPPAPKRPAAPNTKGLVGAPVLDLKLKPETLGALKARALYETLHYRLEHHGRGRVISPADIARRLIDDYFEKVSPLPEDPIGAAVRAIRK